MGGIGEAASADGLCAASSAGEGHCPRPLASPCNAAGWECRVADGRLCRAIKMISFLLRVLICRSMEDFFPFIDGACSSNTDCNSLLL